MQGLQGHLVYADDVAGAGPLKRLQGERELAIEGQAEAQLIMEEADRALRQVIAYPNPRQCSLRMWAGRLAPGACAGRSSLAQLLQRTVLTIMSRIQTTLLVD